MKALLIKIGALLQALMLTFGFWGVLGASFLDSAFLPLPEVVDFCLMSLCIARPHALALYAAASTAGSVIGSLILYQMARLAGHAAAERRIGKERMARMRAWFEKYEAFTIFVPAILPPPVPFKAFVITAGVVEVHMGRFLLALIVGRGIRFFAEAFLAVRYGHAVWNFLATHGPLVTSAVGVALLLGWLIARLRGHERLRRAAGHSVRAQ